MDRGAWWATVLGVAKSRTRLSAPAHINRGKTKIFLKTKTFNGVENDY